MSCNPCKSCSHTSWFRRTCGSSWLHFAPLYALLLAVILVILLCFKCCSARSTVVPPSETPSPTVAALMYHHLLPDANNSAYAGNSILTDTAAFEQQLSWLRDNGWQSVTPDALYAFLKEGGSLPEKSVLITFDDGYLSNAEYAAPLLRQYGFSATVFLVTSEVTDQPAAFDRKAVQSMDSTTLCSCSDVFTYAIHTNAMHKITGSGRSMLTDSSGAQVTADLQAAQQVLSGLPSAAPGVFSYPYGFFTQATIQTLQSGGVHMAFLASGGKITAQSDPMQLPRYPVSSAISMKTFEGYFS